LFPHVVVVVVVVLVVLKRFSWYPIFPELLDSPKKSYDLEYARPWRLSERARCWIHRIRTGTRRWTPGSWRYPLVICYIAMVIDIPSGYLT